MKTKICETNIPKNIIINCYIISSGRNIKVTKLDYQKGKTKGISGKMYLQYYTYVKNIYDIIIPDDKQ